MDRPLLLFDNPAFLIRWRGGSHATWRRWYRCPLMQAGAAVVLILIVLPFQVPGSWNIGATVIATTAVLSTLAPVNFVSRSLSGEWRRGRLQALMQTPLANRDLAAGVLWGDLSSWLLWLAAITPLSLVLILADHPPGGLDGFGGALGARQFWTLCVFYSVTQTLFSAAITFDCLTRWQSPRLVSAHATWRLVIIFPLTWFLGELLFRTCQRLSTGRTWASVRNWNFDDIRGVIANPIPTFSKMNDLYDVSLQIAKVVIALWLIRRVTRRFHGRIQALME
jgi:hypothetical protein